MHEKYFSFQPDLVLEATSACDRACIGCYAPNAIAQKNSELSPEFFISLTQLYSAISLHEIPQKSIKVSIRGGEPSLHPDLRGIFNVLDIPASEIYLETHGQWIVSDNRKSRDLLSAIKHFDVIVKLSFDSMHGLSATKLTKILQTLNDNDIKWLIAITESLFDSFKKCREMLGSIPNSRIIFQQKQVNFSNLIRPRIGVISVSGKLNATISSKSIAELGTK